LKAIFSLAFVAFLRLGEILIRSKAHSEKVLQVADVAINYEKGTPANLNITLRVSNRRIAQELEKGALYGLKQLYIFMYSLYWAQVMVFLIGNNRKKGRLTCLNIFRKSQCDIKVCLNNI
jgi:hypothetical protein